MGGGTFEGLQVAQRWEAAHGSPGLCWAPIRRDLEPPSPILVRAARLGVLVTGAGVAWLILVGAGQRSGPSLFQASGTLRTVALSLAAPEPRAPGPAASGLGHVQGTGTIDPRLKHAPPPLPGLPEPLDPSAEASLPGLRTGSSPTSLDLSLPVASGGTGWAKGRGHDATRGGLKAEPVALPPSGDGRLVVLLRVDARYTPPIDEEDRRQPVIVRLTVGADGVPLAAEPLSGPERRFPEARAAALRWRFEPLAAHGLPAPQQVRITFRPH